MNERPEDRSGERRSGERRRGGPLGDGADENVDQSAQTRREPPNADDATQQIPTDDVTRQIPSEDRPAGGRRGGRRVPSGDTQEFESLSRASTREAETRRPRSIRSLGRGSDGGDASRSEPSAGGSSRYGAGYSTGYNDVLRDREEYLRDIYGGIDWLASFVGFVFTLLCAALFGTIAGTLLLVPLGLQQSLAGGQLNSTAITGFAVLAGVIFLAFLFGGYVSGRMARYDGARNGAMVLLWTLLVALALVVLSGLLSNAISGTVLGGLVGNALAFSGNVRSLLGGLGGAGAVIAGGALLAALLGGMLGGRLGSRYHREIDYTP